MQQTPLPEEKKEERKKSLARKLINIAIVILIIHILLLIIKVPVQKTETYTEEVFLNYTAPTPFKEECTTREYSYQFVWVGWLPEENDHISPRLQLTNLHNREGTFKVYFAFFNEAEYNYAEYEGISYELV